MSQKTNAPSCCNSQARGGVDAREHLLDWPESTSGRDGGQVYFGGSRRPPTGGGSALSFCRRLLAALEELTAGRRDAFVSAKLAELRLIEAELLELESMGR